MRVGELLDAAIKLYRAQWKTFMGIAAFVLVPYHFVEQFLGWRVGRPFEDVEAATATPDGAAAALAIAFGALGFLFIQPFLTGAFARATSEIYLGGAPSIGDTYRFALSRTHSILWVTFLAAMAAIFGLLALVIGAVFVYVRFLFGPAVVIVEGTRGTDALRRSWRLARGFFWKILGTTVLAGILTSIIGGILQFPLGLAGVAAGESGWFLAGLGAAIAAVITGPFSAVVGVLLYFDMRIRKEGLDLALMAQEIERGASEA